MRNALPPLFSSRLIEQNKPDTVKRHATPEFEPIRRRLAGNE